MWDSSRLLESRVYHLLIFFHYHQSLSNIIYLYTCYYSELIYNLYSLYLPSLSSIHHHHQTFTQNIWAPQEFSKQGGGHKIGWLINLKTYAANKYFSWARGPKMDLNSTVLYTDLPYAQNYGVHIV